jgi:hypothetical protein
LAGVLLALLAFGTYSVFMQPTTIAIASGENAYTPTSNLGLEIGSGIIEAYLRIGIETLLVFQCFWCSQSKIRMNVN